MTVSALCDILTVLGCIFAEAGFGVAVEGGARLG